MLLAPALALCAQTRQGTEGPTPRLPANALPVPLFRQSTGYACGAAAMQAVLYYWKVYDGQESALYKVLGTTPADGTPPERLVEGARSFGLEARMKEGCDLADLRATLAAGETVILNLQAWRDGASKATPWKDHWEDGHYVVLVAMDEARLYVMDPSVGAGYAFLPQSEFLDRWHDYTNAGGTRREYRRLAIFIKGRTPLGASVPLTRME
jgi:predicted double-glycine peptidase